MPIRDDQYPFGSPNAGPLPSLPKVYGPLVRPPADDWRRRPPLASGAPYQTTTGDSVLVRGSAVTDPFASPDLDSGGRNASAPPRLLDTPLQTVDLSITHRGDFGGRVYRPVFISPNAANPMDGLQVIQASRPVRPSIAPNGRRTTERTGSRTVGWSRMPIWQRSRPRFDFSTSLLRRAPLSIQRSGKVSDWTLIRKAGPRLIPLPSPRKRNGTPSTGTQRCSCDC